MTIHQCPKCELRFDWKTELDDHCWHDHPEFSHKYPARPAPPAAVPATAGTVNARSYADRILIVGRGGHLVMGLRWYQLVIDAHDPAGLAR